MTSSSPVTGKMLRSAMLKSLAPRERIKPSQWAARYRKMTSEETSEPGPWRNDRTPYAVEMMDAAADPVVEEIDVLKGAQIAWSEICRNILGFWVDLDPGPTMLVGANQKATEDQREERIDPLTSNTPAVRRHLRPGIGDNKKHRIRFDTMTLHFAWAGSSQALKSRPIQRLILEEPDEFPADSGAGGDPIAKAEKRLTTYADKGRAKKLIGGTPTTRTGAIMRRWDACADRRFYFVPCPHCGGYQKLVWGGKGDGPGVKWGDTGETERAKQANGIETRRLGYYQCGFCKARIEDHHKPEMLRRGKWVSESQQVDRNGTVTGARPPSKRVGFFIPSLYSPWVSFSTLAAEWVLAQNDRQSLVDFLNQRLAEPSETISVETTGTVLEEKLKNAPPALTVPSWAVRLIACADTQGAGERDGYFYYTIRAWGYGWRSKLIEAGVVTAKAALLAATIQKTFPIEDSGGRTASPHVLYIDSGGPRWQEIYAMALAAPTHVRPTKGANRRLPWMLDKSYQKDHGMILWTIDTQQTKDQLHLVIHGEDQTLFQLNDRTPPDYAAHLQSEHKVLQPNGVEAWTRKPGNPPNHFLDCEQQQVAAAWFEGLAMAQPQNTTAAKPEPEDPASWATDYRRY